MNWIKENKTFFLLFLVTLSVSTIIVIAQGCNLRKFVKLEVPPDIAIQVDLPEGSDISLFEADMVWEDWTAYVESNSKKFKLAVSDAEERYKLYENLTSTGLGALEGVLPAIPGGSLILTLLAGTGGLLLKRPKEDARVSAEKGASYNAGIALGKTLAQEIKKV